MSRSLSRHALYRAKQADRNRIVSRDRVHNPRTVDTQEDDLAQRKRMEKLWEQSIDFFAKPQGDDECA